MAQIKQRDTLTTFLYKTGADMNIVNQKYEVMNHTNKQQAFELRAVHDVNEEQVRGMDVRMTETE